MRMSSVRLFTSLCLLILEGCAANPPRPSSGDYHVSGGLKGAGGSTLPAAQVQLFKVGENEPAVRADAAADGHFSLVAPGPGDYSLRFVAPGHPSRDVYLQILPDAREVSLEATLEPYVYFEKPAEPVVIGDWNKLDSRRAEPMQAQPDGTWVLERAVPGDTATYMLKGLVEDDRTDPMSMRGTDGATCLQADHYTLGKFGFYLCQVPVTEGRIHIVLDPRKLPRATGPTPLQVTFAPPYTFLNPLTALRVRARSQSVRAWQQEGFDHGALPGELLGVARDPKQPERVRQMAALEVLLLTNYPLDSLYPGDKGEALARELLQLLPTDSPVWGLSFASLQAISKPIEMVKPAEQRPLWNDFADRNPMPSVQAYALFQLMNEVLEEGDLPRAAALAERLKPIKSPFASAALARYKQITESLKGKPVPAFSATLLDGAQPVSRESLLGRFYLLDFWATWCKPCVQEIPVQEAAMEKFKGRGGFTLLSVSLDVELETVRLYRAGPHKMPWMHVFSGPDMNAPLPNAFGVASLPTAFLVDAEGRVVATDQELHGEALEETLDKLLPPASPVSAAAGARRTAD
ncbi:MAG: thioredoxin-like domain-containing protein [Cystobacter sp.]